MFYPKDSYSHPVQLDLLFRQVRFNLPFLPLCTQQVTWTSCVQILLLHSWSWVIGHGVDGKLFYCILYSHD